MIITCEHCGKQSESKKQKKYCDMACYTSSAEFKEHIAKNMASGRQKGRGPKRQGEIITCEVCRTEKYATKTDIKRGRKTCSRLCYRKYMSERFDRHIVTKAEIDGIQNYDEFLTQGVLRCLVKGCDWTGHNLSLHMNQSHGVKSVDFKKMAGFNLSTGVVSSTMQKNLVERGNAGGVVCSKTALAARKFDYVSAESSEHRAKAAALRELEKRAKY